MPYSPPHTSDSSAQGSTGTAEIKRVQRIEGNLKALIAEHARTLLRLYGITGLKSDGVEDLMYELIFKDPTTSPHLSHLQAGWPIRAKSGMESQEYRVFKQFISDCCNK